MNRFMSNEQLPEYPQLRATQRGSKMLALPLGQLSLPLLFIAIALLVGACVGNDNTSDNTDPTPTPSSPKPSADPTITDDPGDGTTPVTATSTTEVTPTDPLVPSVTLPVSGTRLPDLTSTAVPAQVPTPTVVFRPSPTRVVPTATVPTQTPAPTVVFRPSPTGVVPTATPVLQPDSRFGVIASGPGLEWQLSNLGTKWFIDYRSDPRNPPDGRVRVPYISVKPGTARIDPPTIALFASGAPGSYWYIGGETNIPAQDGIDPASYVVEFDYYVDHIKAADPTAKIIGPSILNWDFKCTGCGGGFLSGQEWTIDFVEAYAIAHSGDTPPIDVWAIDLYPLTWVATPDYPNPLPMTHWGLMVDQIKGFRAYLEDKLPAHADTPIWITEIASHWAYDSFTFVDGRTAIPEGAVYRWDLMNAYVEDLFSWLASNGPLYRVDRWFLYRGFIDIKENAKNGYAGIYLFESGDTGAALTPTGEIYSEFAHGTR